jgi:ABC-type uncharacterized transport system permease subunit
MVKTLTTAFLITWLAAGIRLAGPVLLAALGELFAECSGILNLGIEGTILLGALASYLTSIHTGSPWLSLLAALLTGLAASLFLAWMYVTVRASQVVTGLVFNVLALGIAATVYRRTLAHANPAPITMFQTVHLGRISEIPFVGPIVFGQTVLLYLTLVLVALASFILYRTRFGLSLRAAGESPPFPACDMRERSSLELLRVSLVAISLRRRSASSVTRSSRDRALSHWALSSSAAGRRSN